MKNTTNCKYIISNGNRKYGNEEEINIFDEANFAYDSSEIDNRNEVDDRIYIVYTSGTTGRPKGVVYKHRGIINSLYQMYELGCTGDERIAHISKVTFAFSYHKIFFALATGLTLVNVPNDVVQDIVLFNSFIREYKINTQIAIAS